MDARAAPLRPRCVVSRPWSNSARCRSSDIGAAVRTNFPSLNRRQLKELEIALANLPAGIDLTNCHRCGGLMRRPIIVEKHLVCNRCINELMATAGCSDAAVRQTA